MRLLRVVMAAAVSCLVTITGEVVMLVLQIVTSDSAYHRAWDVLYWVTWVLFGVMVAGGLLTRLRSHRDP